MVSGAGAVLVAGAIGISPTSGEERRPLLIGATTSIENSGLLAHLLQLFHQRHDIQIRAVIAGTGAILKMASRGDVSAVLVHAPEDEAAFVDAGYGVDRHLVMRNRFLIVGPAADPADIKTKASAADAFAAIARSASLFVSRGDGSGTHKAEQRLWRTANIDLGTDATLNAWYRESGAGQGATLNIAVNLNAYCLVDEATWVTFKNHGNLKLLFDRDDAQMNNLYSIILVNPDRFPGVNGSDAAIFADWLTSPEGSGAINSFKTNGKRPFEAENDNQLAG